MTNVVVEHRWKAENQAEAFKVVGSIVDMAKKGALPAGFSLKAINVLAGENRAICNWEAPSASAMNDLLSKVNPPTEHRVIEAQRIF
jgi:hypothetical protein